MLLSSLQGGDVSPNKDKIRRFCCSRTTINLPDVQGRLGCRLRVWTDADKRRVIVHELGWILFRPAQCKAEACTVFICRICLYRTPELFDRLFDER